MKSSCKNFDVFDFKPEDEDSEFSSVKFARKFKNPNDIDKYKFLENFAQETSFESTKIANLPCVDVDAVENDHNYDSTLSYIPLGTEEEESEDPATKSSCGLDAVLLFNSMSDEQHPHFIPDKIKPGCVSAQLESRASSPGAQLESRASSPEAASPCNNQLNCAPQESLSSDESGDMITGAYESMSESSPSTSSYIPGDDGSLDGHGPLSDLCFGNWEMGDRNVAVVFPDYIVYRGRYFTSHLLIFSSNCIEMKDSTVHGNHGTISFEWGIDDIVGIESQWLHRRRIATVKLCLISKDDVQAEDKQGPSGIEELVFTVVNSNWYEKQKEIISLNVRYNSLWNVVFNTDVGGDGEALSGQNDICISKERYCPVFDDPFEEVVYPKGDSDAVSISKRDVDLLQPDTFVNDTIIDFYIKYLKTEMTPEKSLRFHFFNSFFFRKLIDLDKDPPSSFEGRAAFQRVRKWTRKVNLFEKDYVLIPVNFNYHWSLIVICHPGEVAEFQDEEVEKPLKVPCILHMDSIKGTHGGLKDFVQSYLWEEWKEKKKEASEDISSKFFSLRFVPLELPQQQNSFDCGLFLLHYVERFLQEAPLNFSPFQITKLSNFLNVDWFPADEPFLKRASIQKLICKILERENSPAACSGKLCASDYPTSSNKIETGVEFTSERCSPLKSCNGKVSTSPADQKIEITLLPTSSECAGDSGLVLREFFEAGTTSESFLDGPYQTLDRAASFNEFKGAISLMEEDVEVGGQFVHSSSGRTGFQQLTGIAPRGCGFPYLSSDFCAGTSWIPGNHHGGHEDIGASPEMSICASDDSSEVEVKESNLVGEDLGIEERIDPRISLSTGDKEGLTESLASAPSEIVDTPDSQSPAHVLEDKEGLKESLASSPSEIPDVADSGSPSHVPECKGNEDPLNSCPNNLLHLLHQHSDVQENGDVAGADLGLIGDTMCETDGKQVLERSGDDSVTESDEQQAVKRLADDSFPESDELQPAKRLRLAEDLQL